MQPRSTRAAARAVATLVGVSSTTTVFTAPLQTQHIAGPALVIAGVLVFFVAALGVVAHRLNETHRLWWALAPVVSVPILAAVDLLTEDASVTAQIFFVFPILYGASQLRAAGAVVMSGLSIAGEVVVVTSMLPPREALVDAWFVIAALGTTACLLTVASERNARLVRRLEQVASIDALTGLSTRRVFDETAGAALTAAGGGALLLLDVDHFKAINDRYGHPVGDEVLAALAAILLGRSREEDLVCRLGGDEIAVLLPGCTYAAALIRAEEILADTHAHAFDLGTGTPVAVSISIGVAHLPDHACDLRSLYSAADAALYQAKQRGRSQVAGTSGRGEPLAPPATSPVLADSA